VIRKLLALPFESAHVFGTAMYFALGLVLTVLTGPIWWSRVATDSAAVATQRFVEITSMIGRHGWWLAAAAFVGALCAPFIRGDGKRLIGWVRAGCAAIALGIVISAWGAQGSDHFLADGPEKAKQFREWNSDRRLTPWNALFLVTALNLTLAASQITAGSGKKAKGDGGEKK
jgi:hypothetical protein